jgi:DUF1680 family protein
MLYMLVLEPELKTRLDYMVNELALCQAKNGDGYVGILTVKYSGSAFTKGMMEVLLV